MIEAIKTIGEYAFKMEGIDPSKKEEILKIYCEPISAEWGLLLRFISNGKKIIYREVEFSENKDPSGLLYLHVPGGSMGANYSPTYLSSRDVKKAFENRLVGWFKKISKEAPREILLLKEAFELSQEDILNDLQSQYEKNKKPQQYTCFVSITLNGKSASEISYCREEVINEKKKKLEEISNKDGVCSLTGEKGEVFSKDFPYSFYTLDKPGFVTAGFKKEDGWKAFPYSMSTYLKVQQGKKYIDDKLKTRFAAIDIMIIPNIVFGGDQITVYVMEKVEEAYKDLKFKNLERVSEGEAYIEMLAGKLQDNVSLNLLFYEQQQAKFMILLFLQEVFPSRISRIFQTARRIESYSVFKDVLETEESSLKKFSFFLTLRNVLSLKGENLNLFLATLEKIVKGTEIDFNLILAKAMDKIRDKFNEKRLSHSNVLDSFLCIQFLQEMGLFEQKDYKEVYMSNPDENRERAENWFRQFNVAGAGGSFPSSAHKGIFLLGVLTQFLLNNQYQLRKATPFLSKLKGLKMKEQDIIGLLPKIHNKLDEYGRHYYKKLESVISQYLAEAGRDWRLSVDEINYMFVLGMNLYNAKDNEGEVFRFGEKEEIKEE